MSPPPESDASLGLLVPAQASIPFLRVPQEGYSCWLEWLLSGLCIPCCHGESPMQPLLPASSIWASDRSLVGWRGLTAHLELFLRHVGDGSWPGLPCLSPPLLHLHLQPPLGSVNASGPFCPPSLLTAHSLGSCPVFLSMPRCLSPLALQQEEVCDMWQWEWLFVLWELSTVEMELSPLRDPLLL